MRKVTMVNKVAEALAKGAINGGATIDVKGRPYNGPGYAVSNDRWGLVVAEDAFSVDLVRSWVRKVRLLPDEYLGVWRENGRIYLDVSVIVDDIELAKTMARYYNQLAIYSFDDGQTIYV